MTDVVEMSLPLVAGAYLTGLFKLLGATVGPGPPVRGAVGDTAPQKRRHQHPLPCHRPPASFPRPVLWEGRWRGGGVVFKWRGGGRLWQDRQHQRPHEKRLWTPRDKSSGPQPFPPRCLPSSPCLQPFPLRGPSSTVSPRVSPLRPSHNRFPSAISLPWPLLHCFLSRVPPPPFPPGALPSPMSPTRALPSGLSPQPCPVCPPAAKGSPLSHVPPQGLSPQPCRVPPPKGSPLSHQPPKGSPLSHLPAGVSPQPCPPQGLSSQHPPGSLRHGQPGAGALPLPPAPSPSPPLPPLLPRGGPAGSPAPCPRAAGDVSVLLTLPV